MQMTPGKTQGRKGLPQRVSIIMSISKNLSWYRFMCSSPTWSFIKDSKLTKTKPESCVRNVHLLEEKNNKKNNRKEKPEKFVFQMKKGKKEVSPCKLFEIQGQFQHYSHWRVSMGWWHLRLSPKILALVRLSVNFFQLQLTIKLKINFFVSKS